MNRILFLLNISILLCLPGTVNAQYSDTAKTEHLKVTAFILPAIFVSYGAVSLMGNNPIRRLDFTNKNEIQEDHPLFAAHVDNYIQYAPAAAVFGLNLAGIKGKHNLADASGIYLMTFGIMTASVTTVKNLTKRERPDQPVFNSFPSGHTATVFASAEFLNQEYKDTHPWLGYSGFFVATATGVLRTYNNRHWLSDVVTGAGIGILSTKLTYVLYPYVKHAVFGKNNTNFSLGPTYQQGKAGVYVFGVF